MRAGMGTAEREEQRQRYRDAALESAALLGMTLRCRQAIASGLEEEHRRCLGESRGGAGCLCTCHDNPGTEILARTDEQPISAP